MAIQNDFTIFPFSKTIRHDSLKSTIYTAVQFYSWLQDVFDEPGFLSYEIPIRFNTPTSFTMINGWFLDDGDGSNLLQFLTSGGIDTLGYSTISDPIYMLDIDTQSAAFVSGDLDLNLQSSGASIGPLLSFKESYPTSGLARIWYRDSTTETGEAQVETGLNITVEGGTGSYKAASYSVSGDNIYHNLFTIAAFPGSPNPQLYVYQDHPVDGTRTRIAEWSAFTNFDRGTIDVLITTQLAGSLIDGGNITTFVRQTGDTFTFVESTLTTSGRTPVATETAADTVNITEGEHYMFINGATYQVFTAGDVITDVPIGDINNDLTPPGWYAEVVSNVEWDQSTGYLILRGLRGTPADGDDIYIASEDTTANVNGKVGDTLLTYDASSVPPDAGDLDLPIEGSVSLAHRIMRAFQHDGPGGKLCCQVLHAHDTAFDSQDYTGTAAFNTPGRSVLYVDFADNDVVDAPASGTSGMGITADADSNTLISGFSDVTVSHINGTITVADGSGFTPGERVTWNAGASEAIFVQDNTNVITLANVAPGDEPNSTHTIAGDVTNASSAASTNFINKNTETFDFPLQAAFIYAVFLEGGSIYQIGRSLTDIYAYLQFYLRDGQDTTFRIIYTSDGVVTAELDAEEYIKAKAAYGASKAAPFGTLAGGVFFGAQGVWIEGMIGADDNNINLTDDLGNLQAPFTTVQVTVSNTRQFDRVAIYLEAGSTELPDKAQYQSNDAATNPLSGATFDQRDASPLPGFPNDTPTAGSFTALDVSLNKQHRYRYASFNNTGGTGDDGQLVLVTPKTGLTADGSSGSEVLEDSGEDFTTGGATKTGSAVRIGDIIHRLNGTLGFAYVTDATQAVSGILLTTLIEDTVGTAIKAWATGDTFEIHSLVVAYTTSDTFFIPYMDEIEDAGSDGSPGQIQISLTFVAVREIILEVRNVAAATEIIPFKTTGQIGTGGYTQGVIRNEDTVTT